MAAEKQLQKSAITTSKVVETTAKGYNEDIKEMLGEESVMGGEEGVSAMITTPIYEDFNFIGDAKLPARGNKKTTVDVDIPKLIQVQSNNSTQGGWAGRQIL